MQPVTGARTLMQPVTGASTLAQLITGARTLTQQATRSWFQTDEYWYKDHYIEKECG